MVESFGEKYKIGRTSEEIKRITAKLEKNLRDHVNRGTAAKTGRKSQEVPEPGKFVIKPNPNRGNTIQS
jgi:hypothetical protein